MYPTIIILCKLSKGGREDPISLTERQSVIKGDLIVYSYGQSYFPHLHFEVRHGGIYRLQKMMQPVAAKQ